LEHPQFIASADMNADSPLSVFESDRKPLTVEGDGSPGAQSRWVCSGPVGGTKSCRKTPFQLSLGDMRILAISGSLRSRSSNTAVLRVARTLAPSGVDIILYESLGALPHFNPDLDGEEPPQSVLELRYEVGLADGLLISSPEYAHGVPGSLKNALDWLVASVEFPGKAVALLNTSPRATHAPAQLSEILMTMGARFIPEASVTLALPVPTSDGAGFLPNPELSRTLSLTLSAFARALSTQIETLR
jgi:chromate reductase, NAD(P)H dehydrogenase (quinone)